MESGPFLEERERQSCVEIPSGELECLRKAVFEDLGEAVGDAAPKIDELAALQSEDGELAGLRIVGLPDLEQIVILEEKASQVEGVLLVVLGP